MLPLTEEDIAKIGDEIETLIDGLFGLFENKNGGACLAAVGFVIGQLAPSKAMLDTALFAIIENAKLRHEAIHGSTANHGVTIQ